MSTELEREQELDRVAAVYARCHARPGCQAGVSPQCNGKNEEAHHRKMRSQGGPTTDENMLAVCRYCHPHIHAHPAESYLVGTLIASWMEITPWQQR